MSSETPAASSTPRLSERPTFHWLSALQLAFSVLATLVLWIYAMSVALMGLGIWLSGVSTDLVREVTPFMMSSTGAFFVGALLLPSAGCALQRLRGKPYQEMIQIRRPVLLILLLVPLLLVGQLILSRIGEWVWLIMPPVHVLAMGVSILWLLSIGMHGLSAGSPQQTWGIFGAGLLLGPLFSIIVEVVLVVIVIFGGMLYLMRDPVLYEQINLLSEQILSAAQPPEAMTEFLAPYIQQPNTLYIILIFAAVLVPLIEEFFKPLGIWLLAEKKLTPSQGFVAGMLCGAGFALFENLTITTSATPEWSTIIMVRMGTSIIHIFATGITGWATALAWQNKRYWRLVVAYLMASAFHALWNAMSISLIAPQFFPQNAVPTIIKSTSLVAPVGLIIIAVGSFYTLLRFNKGLRRAIIPPAS